jgi:hypothetical protein
MASVALSGIATGLEIIKGLIEVSKECGCCSNSDSNAIIAAQFGTAIFVVLFQISSCEYAIQTRANIRQGRDFDPVRTSDFTGRNHNRDLYW